MKVHRFMSEGEYLKLLSGEMLYNDSRHEGWLTTSVGFCFFTEDPDDAIHWLSGVTDPEYCVTMEIDERCLKKSVGHYRNPDGGAIDKTEYSCIFYSLKTARILNVTEKYRDRAELRKMLRELGVLP